MTDRSIAAHVLVPDGGTLIAAYGMRHAVPVNGSNPLGSPPQPIGNTACAGNRRRFRLLVRYGGTDGNVCAEGGEA